MAKAAKPSKPKILPKSFRPTPEVEDLLAQMMEKEQRSVNFLANKALLLLAQKEWYKPSKTPK